MLKLWPGMIGAQQEEREVFLASEHGFAVETWLIKVVKTTELVNSRLEIVFHHLVPTLVCLVPVDSKSSSRVLSW